MFTYSLCLQYESSNFTIGEWKFILSTKFRKEKKKKTQSRCMILLLYKNLFQIGAIRNQREVCYYDRIIVI